MQKGGRNTLTIHHNALSQGGSAANNFDRNYTAIQSNTYAYSTETGATQASPLGAYFGMAAAVFTNSGVNNVANVTGMELNTNIQDSNTYVAYRSGMQIAPIADQARGASL